MKQLVLSLIGKLPKGFGRQLAHMVAPGYTVGAVAVFKLADGSVLLLRQHHLQGWSLPGGLTNRHERPDVALQREITEELGLEIQIAPHCDAVVIDSVDRRVDCVWAILTEQFEVTPNDSDIASFVWTTSADGLTDPTRAVLDSVKLPSGPVTHVNVVMR